MASQIETYLVSMVEREMRVWCLLTQVIATFTIVKTLIQDLIAYKFKINLLEYFLSLYYNRKGHK